MIFWRDRDTFASNVVICDAVENFRGHAGTAFSRQTGNAIGAARAATAAHTRHLQVKHPSSARGREQPKHTALLGRTLSAPTRLQNRSLHNEVTLQQLILPFSNNCLDLLPPGDSPTSTPASTRDAPTVAAFWPRHSSFHTQIHPSSLKEPKFFTASSHRRCSTPFSIPAKLCFLSLERGGKGFRRETPNLQRSGSRRAPYNEGCIMRSIMKT